MLTRIILIPRMVDSCITGVIRTPLDFEKFKNLKAVYPHWRTKHSALIIKSNDSPQKSDSCACDLCSKGQTGPTRNSSEQPTREYAVHENYNNQISYY